MNYIIKDQITLQRLQNDKTLKRGLRSIKIELDVASDDMTSYERKLNRYYFDCGCAVGRIAVLCSLLCLGLLWLLDRNSDLLVWWKLLAFVFLAAVLGKVLGLVTSHVLLRRTYAELEKYLA